MELTTANLRGEWLSIQGYLKRTVFAFPAPNLADEAHIYQGWQNYINSPLFKRDKSNNLVQLPYDFLAKILRIYRWVDLGQTTTQEIGEWIGIFKTINENQTD